MLSSKYPKIKLVVVFLIFLLSPFCVHPQHLSIGDKLPDSTIENVLNYSSKKIKLSEFKKKFIILDFWSFTCSSCLESFPKVDSLQKLYEKEIQIIMVNTETAIATDNLFKNRRKLYKPNVPFITADNYFYKLLSIKGRPALAWFGNDGSYYGKTGSLSAQDIDSFLKSKTLAYNDYTQVKYIRNHFDQKYSNSVGYHSYISQHIFGVNLSNPKATINVSTSSILSLYIMAYDSENKYKFEKPGRLILNVKDSTKYIVPKNDSFKIKEWNKQFLYDYSLQLPNEKASDRYRVMQQDLLRYFNLEAKIEKRSIKCLVLIRNSSKDKLKTSGGRSKMTFSSANMMVDDNRYVYREMVNQPYNYFSSYLGNLVDYLLLKPFVDQTGYVDNIDIKFKSEVLDNFNLKNLKNALKNYDLDLVEKDVMIDVLVLNELH